MRVLGDTGLYQIVAGERRWRAAQLAELDQVPVVVREFTDAEVAEVALIENIQREDLNPLEEALALSRLIVEFQLTHQQAAEAVGRSRAAVSTSGLSACFSTVSRACMHGTGTRVRVS